MVAENKNRKSEKIFIPYHTSTYGENAVYIFVDFRIKRAGSSNYGGLMIYDPSTSLGTSLGFSIDNLLLRGKACHSCESRNLYSVEAMDSASSAE